MRERKLLIGSGLLAVHAIAAALVPQTTAEVRFSARSERRPKSKHKRPHKGSKAAKKASRRKHQGGGRG